MTGKDDCISITDKTFDLSLDDPMSDEGSATAVDQITSTVYRQLPSKILPIELNSHFRQEESHVSSGLRTMQTEHKVSPKKTSASNDSAEQQLKAETLENLKTSINILMKLSGNPIHMSKDERDVDKLAGMLRKLSEASEFKLKFLSKNYSFLESLYDTTRKECESAKRALSDRDNKLKETERELEKVSNLQETGKRSEKEFEGLELAVERQQKEIREYKRFIKEIMERE